MQTMSYSGTPPRRPVLDPALAGGGGEDVKPWHLQEFVDAAQLGCELTFQHHDVEVYPGAAPAPFRAISDKMYELATDLTMRVPPGHSLLVLPHYRYYTDDTGGTPLPLPAAWDADWWPEPLRVVFRYGPRPAAFRHGEPFAQVVVVPREVAVTAMTEREEARNSTARSYIAANRDRYTTRRVQTPGGEVDNLYNVLVNMARDDALPDELVPPPPKKLKVINRHA